MRCPATLLAAAAIAALAGACHDLELARLRCSVNGRCPDGYACRADGFCTQGAQGADGGTAARRQGESCARAGDCASGVCVDGVCCDVACDDPCRACNLPNNVGSCVAVGRGMRPQHGDCASQDPSTCGTDGLCDGKGRCALYPTTTVCRNAACDRASNTLRPDARCDGQGSCVQSRQALSCAPFLCRGDGSGCADTCGDGTECVQPAACQAGSCGKIGNGLPCDDGSACQSGFCVDGVCCSESCPGQCMACDVAGLVGTCVQVPAGNPHGPRPACAAGDALCAGQCTPASGTACTYPSAETVCRTASCASAPGAGATQTTAASCDGQGACGAGASSSCGLYACGAGGACATSCAGDADCASGNVCLAGHCQAKGTTATPCTATSQCAAGLTCRDGVCCDGACDQACRSCNLPGQQGHCGAITSGNDADTCAGAEQMCDASSACKLRDGQPCATAADCASGACAVFYFDADGDSYGDATATVANGRAKSYCGTPPAQWVANNTDCCDAGPGAKDVHPGQTQFFTKAGPCDNAFDYDCDGAAVLQIQAGGACSDDGDGGTCTAGFVGLVFCGVTGDYQPCDKPSPCMKPMKRVQGCR